MSRSAERRTVAESVEGIAANVRINARTLGLIEQATGLRPWGTGLMAAMEAFVFSPFAIGRAVFAVGAVKGESIDDFLNRLTPEDCVKLSDAVLDALLAFQSGAMKATLADAIAKYREARTTLGG